MIYGEKLIKMCGGGRSCISWTVTTVTQFHHPSTTILMYFTSLSFILVILFQSTLHIILFEN